MTAAQAGRRRVGEASATALAMPRGVSDFTGRAADLAALKRFCGETSSAEAPVVVISGQPGVGKTSFAVYAATALADDFPDGRFFVDLRGLDDQPADPGVVLGRVIRVISASSGALPPETDERSALLRTVLAERRAILLLDNAADEAQVRPFLPAGGRSLVLITSRRMLSGLEGIHRLPLHPLSDADALTMLDRLAADRPDTDPDALGSLVRMCGNLPLALRVIGNRMATRPDWSPSRLTRQLADEERRTLSTNSSSSAWCRAATAGVIDFTICCGCSRTAVSRRRSLSSSAIHYACG